MAEQPVPKVTDDDVRRIALRDFGAEKVALAMSILEEFGQDAWNQSDARVRLAVLKLAAGDVERLREEMKRAVEDYRDVLVGAEYPRYFREIGFGDDSEEMVQEVMDDDWRQYCEWLGREAR